MYLRSGYAQNWWGTGRLPKNLGGGGVRKKNKEGTKFQRWARRLWKKDILKIMFSKPEHMKWQLNNLRLMKISIICFQSIRHSLNKCNLILRQLWENTWTIGLKGASKDPSRMQLLIMPIVILMSSPWPVCIGSRAQIPPKLLST